MNEFLADILDPDWQQDKEPARQKIKNWILSFYILQALTS